jgi:hypothetical protein
MANIQPITVDYSKFSSIDPFGRVFFLDEKVYRGIHPLSTEICLEFLNSELFLKLTEKGLIPKTTIADIQLDPFKLVLEHERLVEIRQHEWTFSMFKEAAKTILEINNICNSYGYELKDAHTYNVLFRGQQAVMVDIGSISKKKESNSNNWIAYEEFICCFYIPLVFWSNKEFFIVRKLTESLFYKMQTFPSQVMLNSSILERIKHDVFNFSTSIYTKDYPLSNLQLKSIQVFNQVLRRTKLPIYLKDKLEIKTKKQLINQEDLKTRLEQLIHPEEKSDWQKYHQINYKQNKSLQENSRFFRIIEILKGLNLTLELKSALDLAGNEGIFSKLLAQETNIKRITLVDNDENAVDFAYNSLLVKTEYRVHTALLNFMFTTDIESTLKRFRADIVFALAITHHLVLTNNFPIQAILERIKDFSKKYVFIEFMPLGLWSANNNSASPSTPEWYCEKWFEEEFKKHFLLIHKEKIEANRVLFVGETNNTVN